MGSIMSAISDDIDEYEHLCERYGEPVQRKHSGPDCYGAHCDELKWKREQDRRAEQGLEYDYLELCKRFNEEPHWGRYEGGTQLPEIEGYYVKLLEDRARKEDGKPPRVENPEARASSYTTLAEALKVKPAWDAEAAHLKTRTRFERI